MTPAGPRPNWGKWRQMVDVDLSAAVALLLGFEPGAYVTGILVSKFLEFKDVAANHASAGTLPAKPAGWVSNGFSSQTERKYTVKLWEFAKWAEGMGWALPDEFPRSAPVPLQANATGMRLPAEAVELGGKLASISKEVLPSPAADSVADVDGPLTTRERKTLLRVIVALATKQGIDLKHPGTAAAKIEKATEAIGHRVAARTIQEVILRAQQAGLLDE